MGEVSTSPTGPGYDPGDTSVSAPSGPDEAAIDRAFWAGRHSAGVHTASPQHLLAEHKRKEAARDV